MKRKYMINNEKDTIIGNRLNIIFFLRVIDLYIENRKNKHNSTIFSLFVIIAVKKQMPKINNTINLFDWK
jgi:hypothetical protein